MSKCQKKSEAAYENISTDAVENAFKILKNQERRVNL